MLMAMSIFQGRWFRNHVRCLTVVTIFRLISGPWWIKISTRASVLIAVRLADCDPSVLSTVSVTFQGTEETELPGLLAIDPASTAKGIAIGIEGDDGTLLPLSTASPYANLIPGNNDLNFQAFVQATPTAMANKALVVGEFSATATFVLGYQ